MPLTKKTYTLEVYIFATTLLVEQIHTAGMYERDAINQASNIVDTAKKMGKTLEVLINRKGYKKRVALVTPDEIILD